MGDRRRTSPSDELLGRARAGVRGVDAPVGEFRPTSPADAYYDDLIGPVDDDEVAVDPSLDAEEIAAALLEAGQIATVGDEGEEAPPPRSTAVPTWATAEPTSPADRRDASGIPRESARPPAETREPAVVGNDAFDGDRWATATNEWEALEAERLARRQRRTHLPIPGVRTLVSIAVVGFFAIGFIVSLLDGRAPIADVGVGECFTAGEALEIEDVVVVDCSETHDSELFARVDMVPAFGTVFPGEDAAFDWLFEECLERFPGYTGETYEESRYWIDMFIPTTDSWSDGDHIGMCTLVVVDDDLDIVTSTGSGRASGSNA